MVNDEINQEENPLLVKERLADVGAKRLRRKPYHWGIFVGSAFLGFAPVVVGLLAGVTTVIGAFRFAETIPWWGGILGILLTIFCIAGIILHLYAITEAKAGNLWLSLAFSVLAWPAVALLAFFLTYVMPNDGPESENSYTSDCKLDSEGVSSKDCILGTG